MNCLPWMFFWFAGLPSQKWVCPSMTKISSPLAVLYMAFLLLPLGLSVVRLAVGVAGLSLAGAAYRPSVVRSDLQTMYFIISFMSPNSMTVLSSVMTMRP